MKYLGLILLMALVVSQVLADRINENDRTLEKHSRVRRSLASKLRTFLENLKTKLREGDEKLGIPVMDPFVQEEMSFDIDEELINGTAQLRNFTVNGLAGYNINKADISILRRKLTIGLSWPHIYSEGLYKFNVDALDDIEAFGDGKYNVTLTDLSFETQVWVKITGGVQITKMETSISLGALKLAATGIFGDEDTSVIVSETISDMVPQLIEDYQRELTDAVNAIVTDLVNEKLKGKSLSDILGMLG